MEWDAEAEVGWVDLDIVNVMQSLQCCRGGLKRARVGEGGGLLTNACCSATRMIVEPVDRDPKYRSFAVQIKPYRLDIQDST